MRVPGFALSLLFLSGQASYELALKAFHEAQFEKVLSVLDNLPEAEAHRPAAFNLRAVALMKLHHLNEAIAASREAARLDPGNPNYAYNVGLMYLAKDDFRGA